MIDLYDDILFELSNKKTEDNIKRFGTLFNTNLHNYYYDTGTGKVMGLDENSYYIFDKIFNDVSYNLLDLPKDGIISNKDLENVLSTIKDENLFRSPKLDKLQNYNLNHNLDYLLENNLEQLIIKLTDQCNFRCRYCIFNEEYEKDINFSNLSMNKSVAKKAIDYFIERCSNDASVTFYGGEPLIEFELMRNLIDYTLNKSKDKDISFAFTTNASLVTEDISKYFESIGKIAILCSLDGPEDIHNSYRIMVDGSGSFRKTIEGMKLLFKYKGKNSISINAVLAPPYTYEKISKIDKFFQNANFIPRNTKISIGYPTEGSVINEEYYKKIINNPIYNKDRISPLLNWQYKQIQINGMDEGINSIRSNGIKRSLLQINNRFIMDEPVPMFPFNGCCVPGVRRLYLNTNGKYYLCERIGISPDIGSVETGIDIEKIKRTYIDEYSEVFSKACKECWAIRMCSFCYIDRVNNEGIERNYNYEKCEKEREFIKENLAYYHLLMEENPDTLSFIEGAEFK